MKKFLPLFVMICLALIMAIPADAQELFSGGSGTEEDPYLIATPEDMLQLGEQYRMESQFSKDKYFVVTASELDFKGKTFRDIDYSAGIFGSFYGVLDGQGVVIKNLNLQNIRSAMFTVIKGTVKNVTVDKSCSFYANLNGGAFAWDLYGTLENCHNKADITNGQAGLVGFLNPGAVIRNCRQLTSITFAATIDSIGQQAFRDCWGLTQITLPGTIAHIDSEAFMYCNNLVSATLEEGITMLPNRIFQNCPQLTEVSLPSSLEEVGEQVFSACTNLRTVRCNAVIPPNANTYIDSLRKPKTINGNIDAINSNIYTIDGKRITKSHSGIIIVNGKKFSIKPNAINQK